MASEKKEEKLEGYRARARAEFATMYNEAWERHELMTSKVIFLKRMAYFMMSFLVVGNISIAVLAWTITGSAEIGLGVLIIMAAPIIYFSWKIGSTRYHVELRNLLRRAIQER